MTDRELLEMAAKAAGIELWKTDVFANGLTRKAGDNAVLLWNPLADDGDALRLATRLRITIDFYGGIAEACWFDRETRKTYSFEERIDDAQDEREATRRAIVRAAAAMAPKELPQLVQESA